MVTSQWFNTISVESGWEHIYKNFEMVKIVERGEYVKQKYIGKFCSNLQNTNCKFNSKGVISC